MSIRTMVLMVGVLLCQTDIFAQQRGYPKMEVGLTLGMTQFLGDLGGGRGDGRPFFFDTDWRFSRPAIGLYYRHHYSDIFRLTGAFNFTQVKGDDAASTNPGREARGLHFKSNIWEFYGQAEVSPFKRMMMPKKWDIYMFGGLGLFKFNPKAEYQGDWVELQPLGTEGQGLPEYPGMEKYKRLQFFVPMGIGFNYRITPNWVIGTEIIHRVTFTDYIDDVSGVYIDEQAFFGSYDENTATMAAALSDPGFDNREGTIRGNPDKNDSYYSILFKVGYILGDNRGRGRNIGCPMNDF